MKDIECPYCESDQYIDHDDGYGYGEDELYQQQCENCEKTFTYNTGIMYHYKVYKADCLNDSDHVFKPTHTFPVEFTKMICKGCDIEREPTEGEWNVIESK